MDTYEIVLLGMALGKERDSVCRNLADAFRTTPDKIELMLEKGPVTIKTNIDRQKALGYVEIIQSAGAECEMRKAQPARSGTIGKQEETPTVLKTFANCGYAATVPDDPLLTADEGKGECPACGAIAAKLNINQ